MHEQSETVQRNGRWVNVYGQGAKKAGQLLPFPQGVVPFGERSSYDTAAEAAAMADLRSRIHGFEERANPFSDAPPSHMPPGGSLSPKGDIGALRQKEALRAFKNPIKGGKTATTRRTL